VVVGGLVVVLPPAEVVRAVVGMGFEVAAILNVQQLSSICLRILKLDFSKLSESKILISIC
jgi:hypothetical protein